METPPPEGYRPTVSIIREWILKHVPKPIRSFGAKCVEIASIGYTRRFFDPPPPIPVDEKDARRARRRMTRAQGRRS